MQSLISTDTELSARVRLVQFGSCTSIGPDATIGFDPFFPLSGLDDLGAAAKRVCASCPVRTDCLAVALTYGEDFGIWGGLTAAERRALATVPETSADLPAAADRPLPLATAA